MKSTTQAITSACLAAVMLATWFTVGCSMGFHTEKHTGPVTVQKYTNHSAYQLLRPDGELIVMEMYYEGAPDLDIGDSFSDIVYVDNGNKRVFVKAEGYRASIAMKNEAAFTMTDNNLKINGNSFSATATTRKNYTHICASGSVYISANPNFDTNICKEMGD